MHGWRMLRRSRGERFGALVNRLGAIFAATAFLATGYLFGLRATDPPPKVCWYELNATQPTGFELICSGAGR